MGSEERAGALASHEIARDEDLSAVAGAGCPWIGYDDQEAATIARFVSKSSPSQAQEVSDYERAHLDRAIVLAAADRRLAKWNACQPTA
jgi:predicted ATPase